MHFVVADMRTPESWKSRRSARLTFHWFAQFGSIIEATPGNSYRIYSSPDEHRVPGLRALSDIPYHHRPRADG